MTITSNLSRAIDYMATKSSHEKLSPSELRRKNVAYRGLSNDEINFCKKTVFNTVQVAFREPVSKPTITETESNKDTVKFTIESPLPLSHAELSELVKADNINVIIDRVWSKSDSKGNWTYSILTVSRVNSFYSKDELKNKLKDIFPAISKITLKPNKSRVGFTNLYLSDDHVGMVIKSSDSNTKWDEDEYKNRLLKSIDYLSTVQKINIFSCGDQMNGWNEQTTRGGHIVSSLSNKEQFDIYVRSRKEFYDTLFNSGLANEYSIIELNNSNHSGLGFSYMANELLKLYVETRYPFVTFINSNKFITVIEEGNHIFIATHGKDDKLQSRNFPLNLDKATESYFTSYMLQNGIDINNKNVHVIKGDLHKFNINECNTFRYVNIPSIAAPSDWVEVNFGESRPGIVVEDFSIDENPTTKLVRFR